MGGGMEIAHLGVVGQRLKSMTESDDSDTGTVLNDAAAFREFSMACTTNQAEKAGKYLFLWIRQRFTGVQSLMV